MTTISKPINLSLLSSFLLFGDVPALVSKVLTQKNLVHALAGAMVSINVVKIGG